MATTAESRGAGQNQTVGRHDTSASCPRADLRLLFTETTAPVVALDGDVKNSTYAEDFAKAYPERYFEGRIAEQNMVSAGAGLAAAGKIAFVSTFGRFMERAFDEIEMAIIGGLPIKLVGTHVGVTLAADGPSQMALADVGFMRALAQPFEMEAGKLICWIVADVRSQGCHCSRYCGLQ
jgi:transketolase